MKPLKLVLSVLFLGFATFAMAGTGTNGKGHKAKAHHHPVAFSGTDYWSSYTGNTDGAFELGVSNSAFLTHTGNWSTPSTTIPDISSLCPGTTYLCGIIINVPTGSSLPPLADILTALKAYYDAHSGFPIGTPFNITVDGVTLTVTVYAFDM